MHGEKLQKRECIRDPTPRVRDRLTELFGIASRRTLVTARSALKFKLSFHAADRKKYPACRQAPVGKEIILIRVSELYGFY